MNAGAVTQAGVRRVLVVTLLLNLAVSAGKVLVGTWSGSLAMVADGYHSLVDGSNNVIGLIVAAFAYRPPDSGHPYGHRKFETAATLVIGLALLSLAWQVLTGALLGERQPPAIGLLNWAVMLVTLAVNLGVTWYESREGRRLNSAYLMADAAHTRSDVYVSLGVVASFVVGRLGVPWADPAVAAFIAVVIGLQAGRILIGAFHVLTDRAQIPADEIAAVVRAVPDVLECRDVRTRGGPGAVYVDLVVHVDGDMTLRRAHEVSDAIEGALQAAHPHVVDVVVHLEPAQDGAAASFPRSPLPAQRGEG
jgi:cation diffusion facilitator family transporter